jgi:LysM repeat protein
MLSAKRSILEAEQGVERLVLRLLANQEVATRRAAMGRTAPDRGSTARPWLRSHRLRALVVLAPLLAMGIGIVAVTLPGGGVHAPGDGLGGGRAAPSQAATDRTAPDRTGDTRHVIRPGETLSSIAAKYGVDARELARYNHVSRPDSIRSGDVLVVPKASSPSARAVRGTSRPAQAAESGGVVESPPPSALPAPGQRFVTLGNVGDTFVVEGDITVAGSSDSAEQSPFREVTSDHGRRVFRAVQPGFFAIRAQAPKGIESVYAFVSPVDSVHLERDDVDWYRTQYGTGSGSGSNCGPAVVSMAIGWATGGYIPVSAVREELGWNGDGGTSFGELATALRSHGVRSDTLQVRSAQDIVDVVDRGKLAVVLFNTGDVGRSAGDPASDLFGRYYDDSVHHYIVIKGYAKDLSALVVYDPMPASWAGNGYRAQDGISMMGRNRYYPTDEILGALQSTTMLAVER